MSTESGSTDKNRSAETESLFNDLPDGVDGWVRYDRKPEDHLFEYWKAGSTHISGAYEQLVAQQLRDGDIRLGRRTYDAFNNLITSRNLSEHPKKRAGRIWNVAETQMGKFPGNGEFDAPPEMPKVVGQWELIKERFDQSLDITKWEYPFGEAEFIVEQTEIISHYSHTKRPHEIRYREIDSDEIVIATEITRISAFEMAAHSMRNLPDPLSEMEEQQEHLQSVKGIGPAKSRDLILLGVSSPSELAAHIESDSNPVNHHHSEAVEKLLTETIRGSLTVG